VYFSMKSPLAGEITLLLLFSVGCFFRGVFLVRTFLTAFCVLAFGVSEIIFWFFGFLAVFLMCFFVIFFPGLFFAVFLVFFLGSFLWFVFGFSCSFFDMFCILLLILSAIFLFDHFYCRVFC